ncbi:hypothetical protein M885DRAFT_179698 [Pelagophyceae sp. CCMP2097]|nr:hypothetical protein M885DRAFT_179698 [Pelagophyceae sp. CCMP2097]
MYSNRGDSLDPFLGASVGTCETGVRRGRNSVETETDGMPVSGSGQSSKGAGLADCRGTNPGEDGSGRAGCCLTFSTGFFRFSKATEERPPIRRKRTCLSHSSHRNPRHRFLGYPACRCRFLPRHPAFSLAIPLSPSPSLFLPRHPSFSLAIPLSPSPSRFLPRHPAFSLASSSGPLGPSSIRTVALWYSRTRGTLARGTLLRGQEGVILRRRGLSQRSGPLSKSGRLSNGALWAFAEGEQRAPFGLLALCRGPRRTGTRFSEKRRLHLTKWPRQHQNPGGRNAREPLCKAPL